VAYLRIVYTSTEFVGKFFPVRKKSAVVENICCTNFFTEKNFRKLRNFQWKGMSFQSARSKTDHAKTC